MHAWVEDTVPVVVVVELSFRATIFKDELAEFYLLGCYTFESSFEPIEENLLIGEQGEI
jgi:hypothetical protein